MGRVIDFCGVFLSLVAHEAVVARPPRASLSRATGQVTMSAMMSAADQLSLHFLRLQPFSFRWLIRGLPIDSLALYEHVAGYIPCLSAITFQLLNKTALPPCDHPFVVTNTLAQLRHHGAPGPCTPPGHPFFVNRYHGFRVFDPLVQLRVAALANGDNGRPPLRPHLSEQVCDEVGVVGVAPSGEAEPEKIHHAHELSSLCRGNVADGIDVKLCQDGVLFFLHLFELGDIHGVEEAKDFAAVLLLDGVGQRNMSLTLDCGPVNTSPHGEGHPARGCRSLFLRRFLAAPLPFGVSASVFPREALSDTGSHGRVWCWRRCCREE
ncbi:hypothetical protein QBC34DRAFT_458692 [Podospora aff. communis PSN243]|uniref:Secreted protein n=1 Tax=Podospora aff. communis PSN243 TaxID=3040156 RepID=A0AAV9GUX5_9PEZI|nr:hypothetical protein QBC34DRAFT_458692 [Podospora aff. communis PSN243]